MDDHQVYDLPEIYSLTPLRALGVDSRRKLSSFLDIEGVIVSVKNEAEEIDIINDYSGLAEHAGFNYHDYMNIKRQKSPTLELLDKWTGQNGTVGNLWMYLFLMGRFDVLAECRCTICERCKIFIPIIREKNIQIPKILHHLIACDFTKPDIIERVWKRLHKAIIAQREPTNYFEPGSLTFP